MREKTITEINRLISEIVWKKIKRYKNVKSYYYYETNGLKWNSSLIKYTPIITIKSSNRELVNAVIKTYEETINKLVKVQHIISEIPKDSYWEPTIGDRDGNEYLIFEKPEISGFFSDKIPLAINARADVVFERTLRLAVGYDLNQRDKVIENLDQLLHVLDSDDLFELIYSEI